MPQLRDVKAFIDRNNIEYSDVGSQYRLKVCPYCGDEGEHFYIHKELGLWDCKKCGESGNLLALARQFEVAESIKSVDSILKDDEAEHVVSPQKLLVYQNNLRKSKRAMEYLEERGFTEETIRHFQLGLKREDGIRWLMIPHVQEGRCVNVKYRSLPPEKKGFKRIEGAKSVLFNFDSVNLGEPIFVTEGETDAMTLWQAGYKNVVGGTLGARGFRAEWIDLLNSATKIYIVYDNDGEGQDGAARLAKRLGIDRCWNVTLPTNDVNDFFQEHTSKDFSRRAKRSQRFNVSGIVTVDEAFKRYGERLREGIHNEVEWPWARLEKLTGGFRPEGMTVVVADPKVGKTSLTLNAAYHNIMKNCPVLFYCLEMSAEDLVPRLVGIVRNIPEERQTYDDVVATRGRLVGRPLYFGGDTRTLDFGLVSDVIEEAILRYDIKLVVFDHLHWLCRDVRNISAQVSFVTRELKRLARECGVHIILIAHPRKPQNGSKAKMLTMWDIKDSGSVAGDVDVIVALHRRPLLQDDSDFEGEGMLSEETIVRVLGSRYGPGGQMLLDYKEGCYYFVEKMSI